MDTGIIILALVAVIVIAVGIVVAARYVVLPSRRSARLKKRFGTEYHRAVEAHGDTKAAERDLSERLDRRENMTLRELTDRERTAHTDTWTAIQQEFVDDPVSAVRDARLLVEKIMADLGYPGRPASVNDDAAFEQRARDLSVDHPSVVADFRHAYAAGRVAEAENAPTEHLREAMVAYRRLVDSLLGGFPTTGGAARPPVAGKHEAEPPRRGTEPETGR